MGIIAWLVVGAIAGYVANWVLGTRSGVIMTVLFGIVGGVVGGLVGSLVSGHGLDFGYIMNNFDLTSIIVAILGAIGVGALGAWWQKRSAT
jgi:uncharacterized membrane protein YeaQ/YmgE (transglycosylase-associated protein family)